MSNKNMIIATLEILGIVAIVWAIWLAFGFAPALAVTGIYLIVNAAIVSLRR